MRPIQPYRRRSSASFWLGALLIMLMAAGGIVGLLLLLGVNLNPFATPGEDPFMVRIPINSRPIPAYERVTREHLLNPTTGGLMFQRVPPVATVGMSITGITADGSQVESRVESVRNVNDQVVFVASDGREVPHNQTLALGGAIMNVNAIIGRVVKKDKRAGMGFQENTFFPQGTPEGIAGATPPGMRAITLDATKLTGVHALNAGDTIDLMASVPVGDLGSFQSSASSRLPGAALVSSASLKQPTAATEPMLLAQGAVVLKPVYVRNEATTSSSLTQGKRIQNVPKYEVAIAVAPDDVIPLQTALNKSLEITCITHSMQPGAETPDVPPADDNKLMAPVTVRDIRAYDPVTREAFVSPATRLVRMEPISRQLADRLGVIVSIDDALGDVARHDIPAGSFVRVEDLHNAWLREPAITDNPSDDRQVVVPTNPFHFVSQPAEQTDANPRAKASKPGAAVAAQPDPIDKMLLSEKIKHAVAISVPWNLLYGAEHLELGSHVDIVASYQLERKRSVRETEKRADDSVVAKEFEEFINRKTDRTIPESIGSRGEPWIVATDAVVVAAVDRPVREEARRVIGDTPQVVGDGKTKTLSGPAIVFAVDSRDVESLTTALNTEHVLFSVVFRAKSIEATPAGYKRIALAPVELPAFELFSDLNWKGLRREIITRLVRIDDNYFRDAIEAHEIADYYGRVLKSGKLRFEHFSADDFMPAGVSPQEAARSEAYIVSRNANSGVQWKRIAVAPADMSAFTLFSDLAFGPNVERLASRVVPTDDERFADALLANEITDYYGRVLKSAKRRFEHFSKDDFMPPGVEPGIAAGIGEATVAVTVSTDQIAGLGRFGDNDRVAIVLTGNQELPNKAVVHGSGSLGPAAEVVVQSARIVRAASDTSDVVTLEVAMHDAAALGAALFAHDPTGSDDKHRQRLLAVGRPRTPSVPEQPAAPAKSMIADHLPIKQAPQMEAIVGRRTETHIFTADPEDLR